MPEGNSETKDTNLQDLQEEAQGLTITTAREEKLRSRTACSGCRRSP